jgi:hypothetical protein
MLSGTNDSLKIVAAKILEHDARSDRQERSIGATDPR